MIKKLAFGLLIFSVVAQSVGFALQYPSCVFRVWEDNLREGTFTPEMQLKLQTELELAALASDTNLYFSLQTIVFFSESCTSYKRAAKDEGRYFMEMAFAYAQKARPVLGCGISQKFINYINSILQGEAPHPCANENNVIFKSGGAVLDLNTPPVPSVRKTKRLPAGARKYADVAAYYEKKLDKGGYTPRYYNIDGGFALLTRVERTEEETGTVIKDSGKRYSLDFTDEDFSIFDIIRSFFVGEVIYAQTFMIYVTDIPLSYEGEFSVKEFGDFHMNGMDELPDAIGKLRVTPQHRVYFLFYEFEYRETYENPMILIPGRFSIDNYLRNTGMK